MCWSGEASAVLATVGLATAAYVAIKGESKELWIPLTFFALMELLQAFTYVYIDDCASPTNQILTLFGYLHIAFQPFFINMVAMYFIPESVKLEIRTTVYTLCAVAALAMIVKMMPFVWAGLCVIGTEAVCGTQICSTSGAWHIAWQIPLNDIMSPPVSWLPGFEGGLHGFAYLWIGFYLPILYGSYRFVAFHFLVGPWISDVLTDDPNEFAAVWCLFSIALCVSIIKSPIRKYLHVTRWTFYPHRVNEAL